MRMKQEDTHYCVVCEKTTRYEILALEATYEFRDKEVTFIEKSAICLGCKNGINHAKLDHENLQNLKAARDKMTCEKISSFFKSLHYAK